MKIEKINENQIRCTLNKEDLESHQIRISELAYGTEKAKRLFRDMMEQAQRQFGFEADNIPLMIEAIPISAETVVLIVTKVEDPDELDTRFSRFAPFKGNPSADTPKIDGADSIIDLFQKLCDEKLKDLTEKAGVEDFPDDVPNEPDSSELHNHDDSELGVEIIRLFEFQSLDDIINVAHIINGRFKGDNFLFKFPDHYKLVLHQTRHTPEEFNKFCNVLSEYAVSKPCSYAAEAYFREHSKFICKDTLQKFVNL